MAPSDAPLLLDARQAAPRIGGGVTAYWLERQGAARAIPCTYIGRRGPLFSERHMEEISLMGDQTPAELRELLGELKQRIEEARSLGVSTSAPRRRRRG
jgi:hypothetical protein